MIITHDPRSGESRATDLELTSSAMVAELVGRAAGAAVELRRTRRLDLARLLDAIADEVERSAEDLVQTANSETALGAARLRDEVARSASQFRLFGVAVREGSHLEAMIDHADDSQNPRAPELRRMLVPVGPVAVLESSTCPFAFSLLGGDTASALAARCPVIVKAHSSHPLTATRSFEILERAVRRCGFPLGTVSIVYGELAGFALVREPAIAAACFTGSRGAAQALQDVIATRRDPIPFYGELSSLNPLIVSTAAARARASMIAAGLHRSVVESGGQLCTKPGIVLIPVDPAGDRLLEQLVERFVGSEESVLSNAGIQHSYAQAISQFGQSDRVAVLTPPPSSERGGYAVAPALVVTDPDRLLDIADEECVGPLTIVARYEDNADVVRVLRSLPGSLTTTIHVEADDELLGIVAEVERHTGRIVFNGYPTNVRISWAQNHGGPWPATNTRDTSVGATSMRRFLRPVVWQDAPPCVLPEDLRDEASDIPRRIDGRLQPALASTAGRGA